MSLDLKPFAEYKSWVDELEVTSPNLTMRNVSLKRRKEMFKRLKCQIVLVVITWMVFLEMGSMAMVVERDFSAAPKVVSLNYSAHSDWTEVPLNIEFKSGLAWTEVTFLVAGSKYYYNSPYGHFPEYQCYVQTKNEWIVPVQPGQGNTCVKKYGEGQAIDGSLVFEKISLWSTNPHLVKRHRHDSRYGTSYTLSEGQFLGTNADHTSPVTGYIGLKLLDDQNRPHYAWAYVETLTDNSVARVKVMKVAFEYLPDEAINIGQSAPSEQTTEEGDVDFVINRSSMVGLLDESLELFADGNTTATVSHVSTIAEGSAEYTLLSSKGAVQALYEIDVTGLDSNESVSLIFDLPDGLSEPPLLWHISDTNSITLVDSAQYSYDGDHLIVSGLTNFSAYGITSGAADIDGDGLPDEWEMLYFGDTTSGVPNADPDGDQFSNQEEYIAGTHPTQASSYFSINTITQTVDGVIITWDSKEDRFYSIDFWDNLTEANTNLKAAISFPQNSYTDQVERAHGFYQINVAK